MSQLNAGKTVERPEGLKIGNKFIVTTYITRGSFGMLYKGKKMGTNSMVAIKLEIKSAPKPQLDFEFSFYKKLQAVVTSSHVQHKGIPRVHYFGCCGHKWKALVMDLLGPSIEKVHSNCGHTFTLKTTVYIAIQLIHILEYFHSRGLIYRDIKPENFLFGQSGTSEYNVLYIIDLGLSKEYLDDNNNHIEYKTGLGITGTARYMSINSHQGIEQCRRDDMQAVGYLLVFLVKGCLPWMGLNIADTNQRYKRIGELKASTKPNHLCAGLPIEFSEYMTLVNNLHFTQKPNYQQYVHLFNGSLQRLAINDDKKYDFDKNHCLRSNTQ